MNTYDWYKNTYLDTHLKLVEQSIQLAQSEFQTRVQMLQFYEKQLDNLRQGKTASGTGTSREAVGKFNAKAKTEFEKSLKKQGSRDFKTSDAIQPMADLMAANGDQSDVIIKIGQEQGLNVAGDTQLERVRLAQQLVGSANKAARKAGKQPDARKIQSAAMTIARIEDPTLMQMTEAELIKEEKKNTPLWLADASTTREGSQSTPSISSDLEFNINDVKLGPDGKTKGLYSIKSGTTGDKPEDYQFSPLTIEQERIVNLENRVNKLRGQIDETYGQEVDIEKIIERGRDIYTRQYGPGRGKPNPEESRAALLTEIQATDKERGTNFEGIYSAYSSVDAKDRRIGNIRGGDIGDDKIAEVASTIYQMKRNKQEGLANEVALGLLGGNQQQADQAVGLAIRALMADSQGKKLPNQRFKDTLQDTLQSFANRMKGEEPAEKPSEPRQQTSITSGNKEFESILAARPPRQAAALRELANKVGGIDNFMGQYRQLEGMPTTEEIMTQIKPLTPPTFTGQGTSLNELVQGVTGVDPTSGPIPIPSFVDTTAGPQFGTPYYQFDNDKGHSYLFNEDGTVTYITSKGKKLSSKFGKDTAQYKDALEYFERQSK